VRPPASSASHSISPSNGSTYLKRLDVALGRRLSSAATSRFERRNPSFEVEVEVAHGREESRLSST
jgi:hypothetical protein